MCADGALSSDRPPLKGQATCADPVCVAAPSRIPAAGAPVVSRRQATGEIPAVYKSIASGVFGALACAWISVAVVAPARADQPAPTPTPTPLIESTYPAAHEIRRPDRTLADLPGGTVATTAYSVDGRVLATVARAAREANKIRLVSARTGEDGAGETLRTIEAAAPVTAIGFRAGDAAAPSVLVALAGKTVSRWDAAQGKLLGSVEIVVAGKSITNPVFAPSLAQAPGAAPGSSPAAGPPLLAAAVGARIGLWNSDSGVQLRTLSDSDGRVRCLGFQPDGKVVLAGSDKGMVRFWNVETGALVRSIDAGAGLRSCAASANHLVVGGSDGGVKVWALDVDDVHRVAPHVHKGPVDLVAFAAKGTEWASAGGDGTIEIRDVASGKQLSLLQGHAGAVTTIAFNPNGQKLASTGADGTLRFWTLPLPPLPPGDLEKITAALPAKATAAPKRPRKLLVFWRADAILHKGGVPAANKAIELMGKKTGAFTAEFSRDTDVLRPEVLARYDAIVFNSTAHLVIDDPAKKQALLDYVRNGGGVIGIHAAIDMFRSWPEGAQIIGATFAGHPWHPSGTWPVKLDEPDHVLARAWAKKNFTMHDEFYELGEPYTRQDRRVLLSLDSANPVVTSATPLHRPDRDFAVSWIKRFGQGKVFYCMFGHLADPFQIPAVLQFYLDGIQYALGDLEANATPTPRPTASAPHPASKL
jgi:type 1 glutamine amidotransferase